MELNLDVIAERINQNEFVRNFIKELNKALEKNKNGIEIEGNNMNNIKLTNEEEAKFERTKFNFLQDYFKKELLDVRKGEIYIVTNKFENDDEYHRYKVAQYKNNLECKHIAFQKDLPKSIQLGDVVRKIEGSYIYDKQATQYVKEAINQIRQDIIKARI